MKLKRKVKNIEMNTKKNAKNMIESIEKRIELK